MKKAFTVDELDLAGLDRSRLNRGGLIRDYRAQSENLAIARYFEDHRLAILRFHRELHTPGANDIHPSRGLSLRHQHRIGRIQCQMSHPVQFCQERMREIAKVTLTPQAATDTTIRKHVAPKGTHKILARPIWAANHRFLRIGKCAEQIQDCTPLATRRM